MASKKRNRSSIKLMLISGTVIVLVLWLFLPSRLDKAVATWRERELDSQTDISFITVRQDSFQKVLDYFTQQMNSTYRVVQVSDDRFVLHMSRVGSSPTPVTSGNSALLTTTNKDARVEVTSTNEIKANFQRSKIGEVYYVKVPTDVLFGLMKLHPNIR